ncbi:MAG: bifunctional methylenetetrahydrofolate dehydrogenase/methenyltetrahydrofolate cyclohydrolase [Mycoplasmoidaceae bacterium]|nr:MAG: bifunctional methylenetetrahydrofolate dehydrogenase/methenyltetrahydrofolate cyclohydrolase [Mycoplasmoidaceae bacterium]
MSLLIDGKQIKTKVLTSLQAQLSFLKKRAITPCILIIQVGEDPASSIYVRNKKKLSDELGVECIVNKLDAKITQEELLYTIYRANNDKLINGILVQVPLPKHIDENIVISAINPMKDVDCFHPENVGKLWTAKTMYEGIMPCTPYGVIKMLELSNIGMNGKNAVVLGRSNIVGKPMAALLMLNGCTVTICHSKTINAASICSKADILIAAIGNPKFVTREYTNPKQVIIDVGINRTPDGKVCGDVDFDNVKDYVKAISPVPGGAGVMTVVMLLANLITITKMQNEITNIK